MTAEERAQAAVEAARAAYQFSPGSYTFDALLAALKARDALAACAVDWVSEVLAYQGAESQAAS